MLLSNTPSITDAILTKFVPSLRRKWNSTRRSRKVLVLSGTAYLAILIYGIPVIWNVLKAYHSASVTLKPSETFAKLVSDFLLPELLALGSATLLLIIIFMTLLAVAGWPIPIERELKYRNLSPNPANAGQLSDPLYVEIAENIEQHLSLMKRYISEFDVMGFPNSAQIAAGELFTEKAQLYLTNRANQYYFWALFTACCASFALCVGILVIVTQDTAAFLKELNSGSATGTNWPSVIAYMFRGIAIGGLFAGVIYYFASISRAYFHEGTLLFNRRHATRLGRLYLLIKYGERVPDQSNPSALKSVHDLRRRMEGRLGDLKAEDIAMLPNWPFGRLDIDGKELEEVFGWNLSQTTAFKDLKPENMTASLYVKLAEALGKVAERTKAEAEDKIDKISARR